MEKIDNEVLNTIVNKMIALLYNLDNRIWLIEKKLGLVNETNYSTAPQSRKRNRPKAKKQRRKV